MKVYWGVEVQLHSSLDLGSRWRWVVSFTPPPLYPQGKSSWYPLDMKLLNVGSECIFFNVVCFGLSIIKEKWTKLNKNTLCSVFIKKRKVHSECRIFQSGQTNISVFLWVRKLYVYFVLEVLLFWKYITSLGTKQSNFVGVVRYKAVSKSFRTDCLEGELQMV
jgi:urease accessory protein UreH